LLCSIVGEGEDVLVIEGQRSGICYLFEDTEILVKCGNNTYGTIPAALLVIKAGDKWERWVSEMSSIRL
jgi:hypothetical protein